MAGNLLARSVTISFSRRTLLPGVSYKNLDSLSKFYKGHNHYTKYHVIKFKHFGLLNFAVLSMHASEISKLFIP